MPFDADKLEALRRKYADNDGGDMYDPKFRKVAEKIFTKGGTRVAPYSGIPTFLTAPYVPVDHDNPDFGDLQVALLGVPMDLGVTNRTGARFGPRALRTIERIGPYNHVLQCAPVQDLRVARHRRRAASAAATGSSSAMTTSRRAWRRSSRPA